MNLQILDLNDKIPIGKYKGWIIKDMIEAYDITNNPQNYLNWAINNWKNFKFSSSVKRELTNKLEEFRNDRLKYERNNPKQSRNTIRGDFGAFSCPGDYMGMGPSDFGIPYC